MGFGEWGLSYSSVGSWYDIEYHDPCWDYTYYDWYAYPCRHSYYDPGYYSYYDPGYYGRLGLLRILSQSPIRAPVLRIPSLALLLTPAYWGYGWGYGHWRGGIHLSFGSLYPYNWFDYGYGSSYYGPLLQRSGPADLRGCSAKGSARTVRTGRVGPPWLGAGLQGVATGYSS